jgi:Domain of unknown function (DUF397)
VTAPEQSEKKTCPDLTGAVWHGSDMETPKGGGRIEVAFVEDKICMRNGEDPDSPVLVFTKGEWDAFVEGAKDGEFDLPMQ